MTSQARTGVAIGLASASLAAMVYGMIAFFLYSLWRVPNGLAWLGPADYALKWTLALAVVQAVYLPCRVAIAVAVGIKWRAPESPA